MPCTSLPGEWIPTTSDKFSHFDLPPRTSRPDVSCDIMLSRSMRDLSSSAQMSHPFIQLQYCRLCIRCDQRFAEALAAFLLFLSTLSLKHTIPILCHYCCLEDVRCCSATTRMRDGENRANDQGNQSCLLLHEKSRPGNQLASKRSDEQRDRHDASQQSQWNQAYENAAPHTAFRFESKLLNWTFGFIDRMGRHGFLLSFLTAQRSYLARVLLYKRPRHAQRTLRPLYGMTVRDLRLAPARSEHWH